MLLRVVDDGIFRDIGIKEGEMFLLPGTSAPRAADTAEAWPASNEFRISYTTHGLYGHGLTCTGNTPHNPVRFADTVGIVIERVRPEAAIGMCDIQYPRVCGRWDSDVFNRTSSCV
jgi:3-hydroxyanthranilate 3,4-dioxygenase